MNTYFTWVCCVWTGASYRFEKYPPCVCMIGLIVNSRKIGIERQAKPGILYFITKKSQFDVDMKYILVFREKIQLLRQNKI